MIGQNEPHPATTAIAVIADHAADAPPVAVETGGYDGAEWKPGGEPTDPKPTWMRANRSDVWFWLAVGASATLIAETLVVSVIAIWVGATW